MRRAALVALASLAGTLAACGGSDAPDGPVVQIAVVADGAAVPLAEGAEGTLGLELTLRSDEPVTVGSLILRGPLLPTAAPTRADGGALGAAPLAPGAAVAIAVPVRLACEVDDGVGLQLRYVRADESEGVVALTPRDVPGLEAASIAADEACG